MSSTINVVKNPWLERRGHRPLEEPTIVIFAIWTQSSCSIPVSSSVNVDNNKCFPEGFTGELLKPQHNGWNREGRCIFSNYT